MVNGKHLNGASTFKSSLLAHSPIDIVIIMLGTNDLKKRLRLHNSSKGAKFTRGNKWKIAYFQEYSSKKKAMKEEYLLKKNTKKRNMIKRITLINYENINSITL